MTLRIIVSLPVLFFAFLPLQVSGETVIEVSPEGSIKTPYEARDRMRILRKRGAKPPFLIRFAEGRYLMNEPLVLGPEDSEVTWSGSAGKKAIFSGGRSIRGWSERPDGLWTARVEDPEWRFEQLWIDGTRATRAREPDNFFHYLITSREKLSKDENGNPIAFQTLIAQPEDLSFLSDTPEKERAQIQALFFHKWDNTRKYLDHFDLKKGRIETSGRQMKGHNPLTRNTGFVIENARAALDELGEWFLSPEGELIYRPRAGEILTEIEAVAPTTEKLVIVSGNSSSEDWVKGLTFRGLSFQHTGWRTPPKGFDPSQAAFPIEAVIQIDNAENLQITDCEIAHTGVYGIWIRKGCRDCTVTRTHLHDLGAGGIRLGDNRIYSDEKLQSGNHTLDNNLIHAGGRVFPCAVGVWVGQSGNNIITHNVIADFLYSGISLGWRWGYDVSLARNNRVEFNHIHHIGQGWLSDMGAVYTLGPSEGTKIRHNVIHDISSWGYGGWGLYNDEGSTGVLMENNLVYRTKSGGYHQHYGKENMIRNNILALGREYQLKRSRVEDHLSFTIENNIIYWETGDLFHGQWKDEKVELRNNLYFEKGNHPISFAGMSFAEWQRTGKDEGSLIADPGFADPESGDFRIDDELTVKKIGFVPFDFSKAGLYGKDTWLEKGRSIPIPVMSDPPPVPPLRLIDDFESGTLPRVLKISEGNHPGAVSVTASEEAYSGSYLLRMQNTADQLHRYLPLFSIDPNHVDGVTRCAFRIWLAPDSVFQHEWRDNHSSYRVGPTLWIEKGNLRIGRGEKALVPVPTEEWIEIEVVAALGKSAGTWKLNVTFLESGERKTFTDLPTQHPEWNKLEWLGFVSQAKKDTTLWIDDLEVTRPK